MPGLSAALKRRGPRITVNGGMGARKVTVAERRARLGVRHRLAPGTQSTDPVAVTGSVLALHATDPATVYLSVAARMPSPDHAAVERALYDTGELVRMLAMRRTMFVVTARAAPVVQAAAADAVAVELRRRYGQLLKRAAIADDGEAWLERACSAALESLARCGESTGAELGRATQLLQTRITLSEGKAYEASSNLTGWVTNVLAAEGRILRGRPRGSWNGNQYRWRLADRPPAPVDAATRAAARAELVRSWLLVFGPATLADVQWWTGWGRGETRAALERLETVAVDLEGIPGISLAADDAVVPDPEPWVALLPGLDPTPMGWSARGWFLGDHAARLFDRTGNVGATVWVDGRIAGGWGQQADGKVAVRLLEDVGATARAEIGRAAARTEAAIGDKRITPRGRRRSPLELELLTG